MKTVGPAIEMKAPNYTGMDGIESLFKKQCMCLVTQSCLTLCNPLDCSPPGSSVHGIFQARTLEWVAISSARGSSWPRDWTLPPLSPALAARFFTTDPPGKPQEARGKACKLRGPASGENAAWRWVSLTDQEDKKRERKWKKAQENKQRCRISQCCHGHSLGLGSWIFLPGGGRTRTLSFSFPKMSSAHAYFPRVSQLRCRPLPLRREAPYCK